MSSETDTENATLDELVRAVLARVSGARVGIKSVSF